MTEMTQSRIAQPVVRRGLMVLGADLIEMVDEIFLQDAPHRGAEERFAFGDGVNRRNQVGLG